MSNKLYKCIALNNGKTKLNHSDRMIGKGRFAEAIFLLALLAILVSNPLWVKATNAQQRNINQVLCVNGDIPISYTNSSFTIDSVSQYSNFSFTFAWENTGLKLSYDKTSREMKNLSNITFTDKTAKYRMEYWVPVILYEYIDVDGNNILNDTDTLIIGYKIYENIEMTNVTIREDANGIPVCEWTYTQIAMPMASNIHEPWERFPTVTEKFHYYPLNGTLKTDIILQNYRNSTNEFLETENASSRIFISYGVRYVSLEPENVTVTVAFDNKELVYNEIDKAYPTTSNMVVFKVNGTERGFFDFGGKVTIDNNPNLYVNGSVGPTLSHYYYQTYGGWLKIGLNYPHVNQTLIHDPYFGLYSTPRKTPVAISFPFEWTIVTAVISVVICTVAIVDYFRTKKRYLKYTVYPLSAFAFIPP